eukprot:170523-Prorocentrum_minimum.AAC.1
MSSWGGPGALTRHAIVFFHDRVWSGWLTWCHPSPDTYTHYGYVYSGDQPRQEEGRKVYIKEYGPSGQISCLATCSRVLPYLAGKGQQDAGACGWECYLAGGSVYLNVNLNESPFLLAW